MRLVCQLVRATTKDAEDNAYVKLIKWVLFHCDNAQKHQTVVMHFVTENVFKPVDQFDIVVWIHLKFIYSPTKEIHFGRKKRIHGEDEFTWCL